MHHMIDPDTALRLVLETAPTPEPAWLPLEEAAGLILAEPLRADRDYPPFPRATMDGYAVRLADAGKTLRVSGEVAAGHAWSSEFPPGTALEIMTGAPCPAGADVVIQKERVMRQGDTVTIPPEFQMGLNIAPAGSECPRDAEVVHAGDVFSPLALACAATFGHATVRAYRLPALAIITTGDELVPVEVEPGPAQIRNSNGSMLTAMLRSIGVRDITVAHALDTPTELEKLLQRTAAADILLLTGAVSEGKYDSVPDALQRCGATPVFHKVTQRPGKPLFFAKRGRQLIFGLPGNPLSCHLGVHRYVTPAIWKMMGKKIERDQHCGVLGMGFSVKGPRTVFQLACAERVDDSWRVTPCLGRGSADMYSAAHANALIRVAPGAGKMGEGIVVRFEFLDFWR
ncbi:MAG: molybdopterin molybdotransferase MoeA [Candidatus Hydrogenedentes bacterium]|nr:molybdopterin molybdotransferase MoeA [Candidatus Hydrogenedentota bacterium]